MRIVSISAAAVAVAALSATVALAQAPSKAELRDAANEAAIRQANEAAKAKEHQVIQQLRGVEAHLANEQKLLERRMAYAAQIRDKGLKDEDNRLLRQAEEVERQAVALYQQRVAQFEKLHLQGASAEPAASNAPQAAGAESQPAAPQARGEESSDSAARRSWWPFGR